jgi:hypothetical protein
LDLSGRPTETDTRRGFEADLREASMTLVMKHKHFRVKSFFWMWQWEFNTLKLVQDKAERFMNEIGAENVVSVSEHIHGLQFTVTVWYREEAGWKPKPAMSDLDEV